MGFFNHQKEANFKLATQGSCSGRRCPELAPFTVTPDLEKILLPLGGKFCRSQTVKCAMLPDVVLIVSPVVAQALVPSRPVEAFDESIIDRLSWHTEIKLQSVFPSPAIKHFSAKIRPFVHADHFG